MRHCHEVRHCEDAVGDVAVHVACGEAVAFDVGADVRDDMVADEFANQEVALLVGVGVGSVGDLEA